MINNLIFEKKFKFTIIINIFNFKIYNKFRNYCFMEKI